MFINNLKKIMSTDQKKSIAQKYMTNGRYDGTKSEKIRQERKENIRRSKETSHKTEKFWERIFPSSQ